MSFFSTFFVHTMRKRMAHIDAFIKEPHLTQCNVLKNLLTTASQTEFGKKYAFTTLTNVRDLKNNVPVYTYERLFPYIKRMMQGEQNVLWPSTIKWFAKSSGTTNARSKFIPVSPESLANCHFKGGRDMLALYVNQYPNTRVFSGKSVTIGGSYQRNKSNMLSPSYYGDISAVIMKNLPYWAQAIRTPGLNVGLMENWEHKIALMATDTVKKNVTSIAGVPTWTALLLQRILTQHNKKNLLDIWPNLEVFFYGAVAFAPYKNLFKLFFPTKDIVYWNTYNASEGIFAIQDCPDTEELLLLLDHGIFYEFVPVSELQKEYPKTLGLDEVVCDKDYALIISTNAGLWRYDIGDTIRFTSLSPYRIKISGRTKHFINVFGEEVVVENAETAIAKVCEKTGSVIDNFTVGPVFLEKERQGRHEWVIEFKTPPTCLDEFAKLLDDALRTINSDYDAKRSYDLALALPLINPVKKGTFYNWMKKKGKLGGQYKVPRLSNSRRYVEEILAISGNT